MPNFNGGVFINQGLAMPDPNMYPPLGMYIPEENIDDDGSIDVYALGTDMFGTSCW